jgi:hypothetical protein
MDINTNGMVHTKRHWWIKGLITFVVLILIALYCLFGQQIWMNQLVEGHQAVFLTNGQVYFGNLSSSGKWLKLTDVYYLQVTQPLQPAGSNDQPAAATGSQPNIQLVKLGNELHGPQDVMYIERDKVLFWENMKDDSKVMDAINKAK